MKEKKKSEKVGLTLNTQKTKIMATSWQMGKTMKIVRDFISWVWKSLQMVTVAMKLKDACSLGKKAMTSFYSILKSRDITLPTKVCLVKAMAFQ